jgi:hydrogenase maturation protease
MLLLGIGNILQKDDGLGVYATTYLKENFTFAGDVTIIHGGVDGIHLLNLFTEFDPIVILDTVAIEDTPASIYAIPATELNGHGLNSGGAHEVGVLQCLDILELQGKPLPESTLIGMVPHEVTFEISLSTTLKEAFDGYIQVVLNYLTKHHIVYTQKETGVSLESIIHKAKDPSGALKHT